MKFRLPLLGELRFNPIVSFFSICLIWTFVGICIAYPKDVPFKVNALISRTLFYIHILSEYRICLVFKYQTNLINSLLYNKISLSVSSNFLMPEANVQNSLAHEAPKIKLLCIKTCNVNLIRGKFTIKHNLC